jgi:hypothetical protein
MGDQKSHTPICRDGSAQSGLKKELHVFAFAWIRRLPDYGASLSKSVNYFHVFLKHAEITLEGNLG